jgi:hypothetical protein
MTSLRGGQRDPAVSFIRVETTVFNTLSVKFRRSYASFLLFKLLFSKIPGKIYAFEKTWIFFGQFLKVVNHLPQWVVGAGMCNCIPSVGLLRSGSFWSAWKKGRIGSASQLSWYTFHIVLYTRSYENISLASALLSSMNVTARGSLALMYQTTRRHILDESKLHSYRLSSVVVTS